MVDYKTIRFIDMLNQLAEKTENGFISFSEKVKIIQCEEGVKIKNRYFDKIKNGKYYGIVYDDKTPIENGYMLVADHLIDELHEDIISNYSDIYGKEFNFKVVIDDKYSPYIEITSLIDRNVCIVVEKGQWYTVA